MKRRSFIAGALATPLVPGITTKVHAYSVGTGILQTVSDGNLVFPGSFVFGDLPLEAVAPVITRLGLDAETITPECNLAVYRDENKVVLFDVGSGPDFMPSAGKVVDSLDAVGLTPEDITDVVFTHAHPDHIWGLLDEFDDLTFYNANYHMGRQEWDYWWSPDTVNSIGDDRAAFAVGAKRRMSLIEDQINIFDANQEILPGIQSIASYGHTPGHMSFEIRNGNEGALVVGDAIGNHHLAFAHPDWRNGADQNPDQAINTRQELFDRILNDDLTIVGFHLPNGGIGKVDRFADGYQFISEV